MISHKHHCLYIHVPKTAGKSLLSLFGLPLLGIDYDGSKPWLEDPYGHTSIETYSNKPWFHDFFRFAFVRHPFDRLVSAFFFLNAGGLNQHDRRFRDEHLATYSGDFRHFVLDGLSEVATHVHFRPQVTWLTDRDGSRPLNFIGRFENFEEDLGRVADQLGIAMNPAVHLNPSKRGRWQSYFDEDVARVASSVYFEDFRAFGYRTE
ncbi:MULTISPECIES: sulfotransferase family 2 domain-containing protein [unclassified Ruegeria]|uniref:sulfotransferase family 2 domain-containing protein n=1 Tax=unclassified Ruegeria TaxID=2625375 RepID=UPI001493173B|nr:MULTISPECIES: sulfotransferase family 2 domain-containing protein [unclassified Ruegeria]NOD34424.1 sulfotransferase family 2 domain-containing protein [Ruegeria sp. HKCCD7296]NOE34250.1 sulfotransferase family 2 domain-containing protein [Ruegeria sp. HKCCD7318]NOE40352.1 sulfotransferase family 2 domain-containing protein [Ruegeria sp. HKCCD7319]